MNEMKNNIKLKKIERFSEFLLYILFNPIKLSYNILLGICCLPLFPVYYIVFRNNNCYGYHNGNRLIALIVYDSFSCCKYLHVQKDYRLLGLAKQLINTFNINSVYVFANKEFWDDIGFRQITREVWIRRQ